jgi:hypothetical protein
MECHNLRLQDDALSNEVFCYSSRANHTYGTDTNVRFVSEPVTWQPHHCGITMVMCSGHTVFHSDTVRQFQDG